CDRRSFIRHGGAALAAITLLPELASALPRVTGAPLPVAVIGAGRQGRALLGELQKMEAVEVVALCDRDERRLDSGVRRAPGAEAFADHRALLDRRKDVEAVFVATPTHLHRAIAIDAIEAQRHVYCEAPLASTVEDCAAMVQAARASQRVCQAGLQGRSNPIYQLARTFYRSDSVRDLITMRAQYHRKTTWRSPASDPGRERELNWRLDGERSIGLAGEIGTQQFDVVHWYTSEYPTSVRGSGTIRVHDDGRDVHDTIECVLTFPSGVTLRYDATLANSFEGQHEVFCGSNASIKLAWTAGWMFKEADAPTQGWEVYANRQQFHNEEGITLIADATQLAAQGRLKDGVGLPNPPLYYAIGDFLKSVLEGAPVACSMDEAARATAVGIAAHEATRRGTTVAITL
ncbi:MAG: Gfo/Idh/MocA family oxidoreductase, partial [Phycisphaerales bacterium]|nr:Gfo/Idh/MocA family oxidoreductase [Phycisphaerales bacterium]